MSSTESAYGRKILGGNVIVFADSMGISRDKKAVWSLPRKGPPQAVATWRIIFWAKVSFAPSMCIRIFEGSACKPTGTGFDLWLATGPKKYFGGAANFCRVDAH
jgi:hypothetical protein